MIAKYQLMDSIFVRKHWYGYLILATLLTIAGTDALTPLGFNHGMLYIPIVMLSIFCGSQTIILGTGFGAILLTLIGLLFSAERPEAVGMNLVIINRIFAIIMISVTTAVTIWLLGGMNRMETRRKEFLDNQEQLLIQHQLLRIASHIGQLGCWSINLPSSLILLSDEAAQIYGVAPGHQPTIEEAINFCVPNYREGFRKGINACIEQGVAYDDELQLQIPDEQVVWVRVVAQAIFNSQGNIVRIQGAIKDISHRKHAEAIAAQSQYRLNLITEAMPIMAWTVEPNGAPEHFNRALCSYCGMTTDELCQPGVWLSLLHEDDQDKYITQWAVSLREGKDNAIDFRIRRHDGEYRWHITRAQPVYDKKGSIIKWYGNAVDIHDHIMRELAYQKVAEHLLYTMEDITDGFFTLDNQARFIYINNSAAKLFNCEPTELLGKNIKEAFKDPQESTSLQQYRAAIASQQATNFEQFNPRLKKWFAVQVYPGAKDFVVYLRDISAEKINHS